MAQPRPPPAVVVRDAEKRMSRAHSPRVCRELLLLVPSFLQHVPALSLFVRSMLVHVADLGSASLRIVLGDDLSLIHI